MTFAIALSGLNSSATELNVVSHNISNSATTGFKSSRVEFTDVYTSLNERGLGGQGDKVAIIRQDHRSGNLTDTGKVLDLSVDGNGYFRLSDNGTISYTRNGAFAVDREGFIVNADGLKLTGYAKEGDGTLLPTLSELMVDPADQPPNTTTTIDLGVNLDSTSDITPPFDVTDTTTYNFTTTTSVYDSLGRANLLTVFFRKEAPNTWTAFSYLDGTEVSQTGGDELVFNSEGEVDTVNGGANPAITLPLFQSDTGGASRDLEVQLGNITQYSNSFGVNKVIQDGFANGRLNDLSIDQDGTIFGSYSNGQSQRLGQIILANFVNKEGLHHDNGTGWKESFGSGSALIGQPGSSSLGTVRSGALEESNVDVTRELITMIGAQRGFQANAQVISTYDTITQTVFNLRR